MARHPPMPCGPGKVAARPCPLSLCRLGLALRPHPFPMSCGPGSKALTPYLMLRGPGRETLPPTFPRATWAGWRGPTTSPYHMIWATRPRPLTLCHAGWAVRLHPLLLHHATQACSKFPPLPPHTAQAGWRGFTPFLCAMQAEQ